MGVRYYRGFTLRHAVNTDAATARAFVADRVFICGACVRYSMIGSGAACTQSGQSHIVYVGDVAPPLKLMHAAVVHSRLAATTPGYDSRFSYSGVPFSHARRNAFICCSKFLLVPIVGDLCPLARLGMP